MGYVFRTLPPFLVSLTVIVYVLNLVTVPDAQAQNQFTGLKEITDAADRLCGDNVPLQGHTSNEYAKGKIDAELPGLLKKLVDVGFALDAGITKRDYQGVLQEQLASTLGDIRACKLKVLDTLKSLIIATPPPLRAPRVQGWLATFTAKEQGGGAFRGFPACTVPVSTPAALDIRRFFPPDLSRRNVVVSMSATTEHEVLQPGRWVYYVRHGGTMCTHFEFTSDGTPIDGNSTMRQGGYVNADASFPVYQRAGHHHLTLNLTCYFLGGQFPVAAFQIQTPGGTWRPPAEGDFTVKEPINPDRPPGAPGPCPWNS